MASDTRPALLSGRWYPSDASACAREISEMAGTSVETNISAVGAILPHAGWVYSGTIASSTLAAVKSRRPEVELIILFAGHLGLRDQTRLFMGGGLETPLGEISCPLELTQDFAMGLDCELESADDFYEDNAAEVQFPLIRYFWPKAELVVIGVPPTEAAGAIGSEALDLASRRGYKNILVLGSTDMTHYGPNYDYQPKGRGLTGLDWVKNENDPLLIREIERLDTRKVLWIARRHQNACCPGAVNACISAARSLGASRAKLTHYTTSYDVRPDQTTSSFVGYAGFLLGR